MLERPPRLHTGWIRPLWRDCWSNPKQNWATSTRSFGSPSFLRRAAALGVEYTVPEISQSLIITLKSRTHARAGRE